MKKKLPLFLLFTLLISCSELDIFDKKEATDVPSPRSYTTYTSQNSVTLNGLIDNTNNYYQGDTYKVGFIFRTGDINNSTNEQIFMVDEKVKYEAIKSYFSMTINSLQPNTKYFFTCFTKNGEHKKEDWEEFTTSEVPCTYAQNNYVSISGDWQGVYPEIDSPSCCDEGNFGIRFGRWPNIYEISFNELKNGYPKTGQYFGVNSGFDISDYNYEVVKSSNQVLIGSKSTPETKLFVNNDGTTLTIIFCKTILKDGTTLDGKVSVKLP